MNDGGGLMRQVIFAIMLVTSALGLSFPVEALTFDELPIKKSSRQWFVEIKEADNYGLQLDQDKYETYCLIIKNIGSSVENVRIQAFRDEPRSETMYGLFKPVEPPQLQKKGESFQFANFPVKDKSTKLEIVITWLKQGNRNEYKESFVFGSE